jgi:MFS family permease
MFRDKTLVGLNVAVFLMMLGVGMIVALLPQRIINLTGSDDMVGLLASFFALSYILLQVPVGRLSDRLGFKTFLIAGYILCFLTGILFYFSHSSSMVFLGRLLQGAGEAPIWALAPALLSIKYARAKGKVMGIYNAAIHLGLTAGPIAGVMLAGIWTGNQAFLFYAAVCLLGAVVIFFTVEDVKNDATPTGEVLNLRKIRELAARGETLITLLGITLYGAGYGIFLTVIPAFLISTKDFTSTHVGVFFALFYIAISLSQLITGPLSDRWGRQVFMGFGLALAAAGVGMFPLLVQPWISVALTLASLGLGVFYLSSMAFLNEAAPDSLKGTISGAYYLFWGIGMFFGPVLVGRLGALLTANSGYFAFSILLTMQITALALCRKKPGSLKAG